MIALSRRRVLAFGAGGAALLAVGGALSWVALGDEIGPDDVPIGLTRKELAVVRAVVDAVVPAGDGLPSGLELGVHQRIDEEVWAAPDPVRADLKAALHLLEHLPPLFGFAGRFSALSRADRQACFARMLTAGPTPVVQAAVGLKQMCHLFTYVCDATWAGIGYDGPWVRRAVPPPSAVRYAALLAAGRGR